MRARKAWLYARQPPHGGKRLHFSITHRNPFRHRAYCHYWWGGKSYPYIIVEGKFTPKSPERKKSK